MKNKIRTIGLGALAMSQKTFVAHHLRIRKKMTSIVPVVFWRNSPIRNSAGHGFFISIMHKNYGKNKIRSRIIKEFIEE